VYVHDRQLTDERTTMMNAHDLQAIEPDAPEEGGHILLSSISLFICW
jgi:hypothetical protein